MRHNSGICNRSDVQTGAERTKHHEDALRLLSDNPCVAVFRRVAVRRLIVAVPDYSRADFLFRKNIVP